MRAEHEWRCLDTGALVTGLQARLTTLTWVGRDGVSHLGRELRNFTAARLSLDGRRVAVIVSDGSYAATTTYPLVVPNWITELRQRVAASRH